MKAHFAALDNSTADSGKTVPRCELNIRLLDVFPPIPDETLKDLVATIWDATEESRIAGVSDWTVVATSDIEAVGN